MNISWVKFNTPALSGISLPKSSSFELEPSSFIERTYDCFTSNDAAHSEILLAQASSLTVTSRATTRFAERDIRAEIERIARLEGDNPQTKYNDSFSRYRANFNLTRDKSIFNYCLSYRRSILHDGEKLKEYDKLVDYIIRNSRIVVVDEIDYKADNYYTNSFLRSLQTADHSRQYLYAARLVEKYHNCPELLEAWFKQRENNQPPIIVFANKFKNCSSNIVGYHRTDFLGCVIRRTFSMDGTDLHEFGHALDYCDGSMDGIIGAMKNDRQLYDRFIMARQELFKNHRNGNSRIRAYAFTNDREFLAVTLETFYHDPKRLHQASPMLYEVYRRFFKFDPLTELNRDNIRHITEHRDFARPLTIIELLDLAEKIKAFNPQAGKLLEDIINNNNILNATDKNRDGLISKEEITNLAKLAGDTNYPEISQDDLKRAANIRDSVSTRNRNDLQDIIQHPDFTKPLSITELSNLAEKIKTQNPLASGLLEDIINNNKILNTTDSNRDGKISKEEVINLAKLAGNRNNPELAREDLVRATNSGR